jgi:hypothetical protein
MAPYRTVADPPKPFREVALVYAPRGGRESGGVRTLYWLFGFPMLLAGIGGGFGGSTGALAGLFAGCVGALSRWKLRTRVERASLTVERGILTIVPRAANR